MSSNIFLYHCYCHNRHLRSTIYLIYIFGDIDADADIDTDINSVVSFKGLTHFGIGFGWYMYLQHNTEIQTYLTGVAIGLIFVFAVWFLYKKGLPTTADHTFGKNRTIGRKRMHYLFQTERKEVHCADQS